MTAPTGQPPAKRAALSRELGEFLIELSIALHKHAMYPEGHPSLEPAAAGVVRRAGDLLQDRPTISLGVARQQLIIEGVATDPKHPVLAELAGRLHRHHLGAATFERGLAIAEVVDVLRTLAVEADRTGQPLGLGDPERLRAWPHIRLHSLTYERLELLEEGPAAPGNGAEAEPAAAGRGVRAAQLWLGLARAALAGQLGDDEAPPMKPAVIAEAIDRHSKAEGYDQVIVGYLLQIADELKHAGGAEAVELRRRTSRLVGAMRPETLRRLIDMGGDLAQRQRFVLDAADGMAVDAVLELVQAAADTSHRAVSHSLVRMLSKLASHAEKGTAAARPLADTALRDQVKQLLSGWTLEDPNPGSYGSALQKMSRAAPMFAVAKEAMYAAEPERIVQIALEVDKAGPLLWKAVDRLVAEGRLSQLLDQLEAAPDGTIAAAIWSRTATSGAVARALAGTPPDFRTVDRLAARLAAAAAEPMLDALAEAEARTTRRQLLDRLGRMGEALVPALLPRLDDPRWYVLRNLLALLDDLAGVPAGFSAAPYAAHADARVRRQALKLQLKVPVERERALLAALADQDEQMVRIALAAASRECPAGAVPLLVARATTRSGSAELRALAIRLLGRTRSASGLDVLLRLTDGGRTLLGRPKLPGKSPELLAALAALVEGWGRDSRATAVLARAAVSDDVEIRAATDPAPAAPSSKRA